MSTPTPILPSELPAPVRAFLTARAAPDAVVTDEGRTFRGTEEVLGFLRHSGSQYTYTSELTGAQRVDDRHWVALHHLEGDFPGGVADLAYRFTTAGDRIAELVIAP